MKTTPEENKKKELLGTMIVEALEKILLDTSYEFSDRDLHLPVRLITETLETIDDCEFCEDDFNTNGWAWDWWLPIIYKDFEFTISGSGYDGGLHITFTN